MGQIDQAFFPPRYWQQFEDLTLGCFREFFAGPTASKNGRSGYPQAGVDVYGDTREGYTGIQCKQVDPLDGSGQLLPGGLVSQAQLKSEVLKAETFQPQLDAFILATTAPVDPKLQLVARRLSDERQAQGKFRVSLWFWDDYRTFLNGSVQLQKWFYQDVLALFSPEDQDRQILEFFAMTFHRPAFEHPLSIEDLNAFPQALEDTQTALRTGQLRDRRSRSLIRQSLSWRQLSDPRWRRKLQQVDKHVAALRKTLLEGTQAGLIHQRDAFMEIRDPRIRDQLEALRQACIAELNDVLHQARIAPV